MDQNIDKILSRAAKLLAVQEDRGCSEAEAAVAAEHLQRLLQDHNLSLSQIESHSDQSGGAAVAKRIKGELKTSLYAGKWRSTLLGGIAANNFCLARPSIRYGDDGKRHEWTAVIGREVNVNVTKMTYDYLATAFTRAAKEHGLSRHHTTRTDYVYFMDGAVGRVIERLDARRCEREAEDVGRENTSNGTHRELVLSDVYGSEADLNNDLLNSFAAGTTAANRRESHERSMRQQAEHDRLVADGVDSNTAWYRAWGYSEEQATEYADRWAKQSRRRGGRHSHRATNWSRSERNHYRKISSESYKSGRDTGNDIGLDSQVGAGNPRRIT